MALSERRLGRAMQALGKATELSRRDRDFQCLGFLLGIAAVWLYAPSDTLWSRTEYRNPRWTGRLGDCRVSP